MCGMFILPCNVMVNQDTIEEGLRHVRYVYTTLQCHSEPRHNEELVRIQLQESCEGVEFRDLPN